jgi:hypothetical protein
MSRAGRSNRLRGDTFPRGWWPTATLIRAAAEPGSHAYSYHSWGGEEASAG